MRDWTHKVVRWCIGTGGELFALPTSHTGTLEECVQYAERLARRLNTSDKYGVRLVGDEVHVIARKGGRSVKRYLVDRRIPAGETGEVT